MIPFANTFFALYLALCQRQMFKFWITRYISLLITYQSVFPSANYFLQLRFLPFANLITSVGIAVATWVVATGVAGLNAEGGWVYSKASEVVAHLISRTILFLR
jgi:hypothetical protein